ncbi:MAG: hypothetical protein PHN97_12065, partial [Smithellaceae bacterium]|nr:hypothetical protein [Smithellaceae bacterium]
MRMLHDCGSKSGLPRFPPTNEQSACQKCHFTQTIDFADGAKTMPLNAVGTGDPNVFGLIAHRQGHTRKMQTGAGFEQDVLFVTGARRKCRVRENPRPHDSVCEEKLRKADQRKGRQPRETNLWFKEQTLLTERPVVG